MAVRYQAQCRRTVPRAVSAPSQAIWVTDTMLRQAIEQYQQKPASHNQRRRLSSQTSPIETRRRLGKRHMTGAMPMTPYNPTWHFDMIPSMTGWQWQAPTTKEERLSKRGEVTAAAVFNKFLSWLEKSDADKPFLTPPVADAISTAPITEDVPRELLTLRTSIANLAEVTLPELSAIADVCQRSLKLRVLQGQFSAEEMLSFMEPLDAATKAKIGNERTIGSITSRAQYGVVAAMGRAYRASPEMVSDELWMALAANVCWRNGTSQHMRLFKKLLRHMPTHLQSAIPSIQIFNIFQGRLSDLAAKLNGSGRWSSKAETTAQALASLSSTQKAALERQVSAWIEHLSDPAESQRFEFAWMVVRAYDASVTQDSFLTTYQPLTNTFTPSQKYQLLLARLQSLDILTPTQHADLIAIQYASNSHRWSSLIQATPDTCRLYECISDLGLESAVTSALCSPSTPRLQMQAIRTLAANCGSHTFALALHDALVAKHGPMARRWRWQTWSPHIEAIVADETCENRLWQLLDITRSEGSSAAKMALVDRMAQAYASSEGFTERQLLRRFEACARFQRAISGEVSDAVMMHILNAVTQDLERGGRGRSARLEWMVRLVEEKEGMDKAHDFASKLRGWRWVIDQNGPQ